MQIGSRIRVAGHRGAGTASIVLLGGVFVGALLGCGASLRSDLEDAGLRYPLHVQRKIGPPQVANPRPYDDSEANFCRPAPHYATFLENALAALSDRTLTALIRERCPTAEAHAFLDPFVVEQAPDWGPFLALRMECHGRGTTVDSIPLDQAISRAQSLETELFFEGWKVRGDSDHFIKWNIALFRPTEHGTRFERFLVTGDDLPALRNLEEFVDALDVLSRCGREPIRLGER
jgi:hypothetical protein